MRDPIKDALLKEKKRSSASSRNRTYNLKSFAPLDPYRKTPGSIYMTQSPPKSSPKRAEVLVDHHQRIIKDIKIMSLHFIFKSA